MVAGLKEINTSHLIIYTETQLLPVSCVRVESESEPEPKPEPESESEPEPEPLSLCLLPPSCLSAERCLTGCERAIPHTHTHTHTTRAASSTALWVNKYALKE